MSQLNVDTIGSQTGTNVQLASGHTLKDKDGTAFDTQSDLVKLHSVNVTSAVSTVDFFYSDTGWRADLYHSFIVKFRWVRPVDDDRRLYWAMYHDSSLRSGTYESHVWYERIDSSQSGGNNHSYATDYVDISSGTTGTGTREGVRGTIEVFPAGDGFAAPSTGQQTWWHSHCDVRYENGYSWTADRRGMFDSTSYVNGCRFYMNSGNIAQGQFDFYGVRR